MPGVQVGIFTMLSGVGVGIAIGFGVAAGIGIGDCPQICAIMNKRTQENRRYETNA
jgi:hypothetical protein